MEFWKLNLASLIVVVVMGATIAYEQMSFQKTPNYPSSSLDIPLGGSTKVKATSLRYAPIFGEVGIPNYASSNRDF